MLSEICASIPVAKMALEQEMIHLMPNLAGTQETALANGTLIAAVVITMPILYLIDKKIVEQDMFRCIIESLMKLKS